MRVLVVDDDEDVRETLADVIMLFGHDAVTTSNGSEAIEVLSRETIRLVVSDCHMPKVDGLALCRWIRQQRSQQYTYFILSTGRRDRETALAARRAGADAALPKPFDPLALDALIRKVERVAACADAPEPPRSHFARDVAP